MERGNCVPLLYIVAKKERLLRWIVLKFEYFNLCSPEGGIYEPLYRFNGPLSKSREYHQINSKEPR